MVRLIPIAAVAGAAFGVAPSIADAAVAAPASPVSVNAVSVARASSNPCTNQSQSHIVENFVRGPSVYPLRCGTKTWGYIHLVAGHEYDPSMLALGIARGTNPELGIIMYYPQPKNGCPTEAYRIIENSGALNGTGVRPQGIITAYWVADDGDAAKACN